MSIAGRSEPLGSDESIRSPVEWVRLVPCYQTHTSTAWVDEMQGLPCEAEPPRMHIQRYERANRRGLVSDADLVTIRGLAGDDGLIPDDAAKEALG